MINGKPGFFNYINLDAGQVFSGRKSGVNVGGYDAPSDRTPSLRPNYVMPAWGQDVVAWFIYGGDEPLYITGPSGCGKTSMVKQVAAMLNYPVWEITGHNRLETPDLVGHFVLRGGSTAWVDGPLTAAIRSGGLFLANEIDLIDPSTLTGLNSVLDGSPLSIVDTDEVVRPARGFRFVATANTNGSGEGGHLYLGTLRQNVAFQNRFMHIKADYLSEEQERALLRNTCPSLPDDVFGYMLRVAGHCRALLSGGSVDERLGTFDSTNLEVPVSTRTLLRWAYWTNVYEPLRKHGVNVLEKAMDVAIANSCDAVTRSTLHELLQRVTGMDSNDNKEN